MNEMKALTETIEIVQNARDSDSGLNISTLLKRDFETFELVFVMFDFAINVRYETVFEDSFPW